MKIQLLICLLLTLTLPLRSQVYDDYIGAGHDKHVRVFTSSNEGSASGINTINGEGLDAAKMEAARFFSQATFGADINKINALAESGNNFEAWIDEQLALPTSNALAKLWEVNERSMQLFEAEKENEADTYFGPFEVHFNYTWTELIKKNPDQLRQRIAYALSQIAVISTNSQLSDYGEGLASYYDILLRNAFGNYEDLLNEITVHPMMAFYLSHLNNPKTNTAAGIHPDENYAREIMQLFTIGLYELNNDGTLKMNNGAPIPTYDNNDIKELAKVFTGLGIGAFMPQFLQEYPNAELEFGVGIYVIDKTTPLRMYEDQHEPGPKQVVGGHTIPSGQSGMKDIRDAVHHLFMHDNVGPFIAYRLIQQLVKSNPTPAYVNRVANAFNNNGQGVRGDMKAVIKAILLDEEARSCAAMQNPTSGKLREPLLRFTNVYMGVDMNSPSGYYWDAGEDFYNETKQKALSAPSVFNFYRPDYQPVGDFTQQGLVAPEFKINDSQTSIGYLNQVNKWASWGILFWDWHDTHPNDPERDDDVYLDWTLLEGLAHDPESLINHLDIVFTHGRMSNPTRQIIKDAITPFNWNDGRIYRWRAEMALYLTLISPDYVVLK